VKTRAGAALDKLDAGPIGGHLDLYAGLEGDQGSGWMGAGLDAGAHLSPGVSAFATGRVGEEWDPTGRRLAYDALAGLRVRW